MSRTPFQGPRNPNEICPMSDRDIQMNLRHTFLDSFWSKHLVWKIKSKVTKVKSMFVWFQNIIYHATKILRTALLHTYRVVSICDIVNVCTFIFRYLEWRSLRSLTSKYFTDDVIKAVKPPVYDEVKITTNIHQLPKSIREQPSYIKERRPGKNKTKPLSFCNAKAS